MACPAAIVAFAKMKECPKVTRFPFACLPAPNTPPDRTKYPPPPDFEQCMYLWDKYEMLDNIRAHSRLVAHIATSLAKRAFELGLPVNVMATQAAGLLHDLAKTWCLKNGGSHAMIGASWTIQDTAHYGVAQGVILHVHWPWKLPEGADICCLPIFVIYADKRVRHDRCVSLQERFNDLIVRYGKSGSARKSIRESCNQAKQIEAELSKQLDWNLNEDTFDSGWMVP